MLRRLGGMVAALLLLATAAVAEGPLAIPSILQDAEQTRIDAVARAIPSAISVFVPGGGGGGSGMLISSDGFALTNFHVTSPAGSYMRCGLSDGNIYDALIVGIDPVGDLAMIQLLGQNGQIRSDFPAATLGSSRTAQPGDWCMVIGNPFLLASNLQPTVTYGILSGVGRYQYPSGTLLEYGDCLQTDASINPGNSGGPIYDSEAKLIGIVGRCSFEKRGRVNVGVGYAISINQAKNFLGVLHSGRIVDHATLGATVATDPDGGARVTNILESSDAYRRGLRFGAEILEIDGRLVQTANDVQNVLATFPAAWRVSLRYRLEGETRQTLVRLASVHAPDELLEKMAGALPPPPPREEPPPPSEEPVPDDERQQNEEQDGQDDGPKTGPNGDRQGDVPGPIRDRLIERRGYANYFYNQQRQDQFIASLRAQYPADSTLADADLDRPMTWLIEGQTDDADARPVSIRIGPDAMTMTVDQRPIQVDSAGELYEAVSKRDYVGMVAALDSWRRMIATGPAKFGETFYWGTMPLGGQRPLRDCVVGIAGETETRWISHPVSHAVEVIEVFADRDEDPAELWIIRDADDLTKMPTTLDLRYGTGSILRVKLKSWKLAAEAEEKS